MAMCRVEGMRKPKRKTVKPKARRDVTAVMTQPVV